MVCKECGEPLSGRRKQFCSISCRNTANGRKSGGRNKTGPTVTCEECGKQFHVPPSRTNVRACSRECLGKIQSRERKGKFGVGPANPMWTGGIQTYRQHRKDACERCGSDRFLVVHHKDENRYNNDLANLETLCKRCHQLHHDCAKNLPSRASSS